MLTYVSLVFPLNLTLHDFHNPEASHILDTHIMDDILIVVGMVGGVEVYDISNPEVLNHIAHFNIPNNGGGGGSKPNCVTSYQSIAYFTAKNGVAMVDFSNPNNPNFLGYINNTNNLTLENVDVSNTTLAVCAHTDGVLFFDVATPENPSLIHSLATNNAWAVAMNESNAYIADEQDLLFVDISNFDEPTIVQEVSFTNSLKDVMFGQDNNGTEFLAVALGSDGVAWIDSENATIVDVYNTSALANRLTIIDDKIVVSDWDDIEVISLNESTLELIGYKNTTRRPMAITSKNQFIYSAEWGSVQIFEYGNILGADLDLSTYELNFPLVENGQSYTMTLEVINNGQSEAIISDAFATNSEFETTELSNIPAGESQTIEVTYTAGALNASGSYQIFSNDADESLLKCETNGNIIGANVGDDAPDFNLEIVANGTGYYQLSDHLDEVVVLIFFSPL
jgi:hypothetical protein